jgi:uncharacterized alpha-E superfamily protein
MLARVAAALYDFARQVERAATIAHVLSVCHASSLESATTNGQGVGAIWEPVLQLVGDAEGFAADHRRPDERTISWYLTLSDANPQSIVACMTRARDQLGTIRSRMPTELFEVVSLGEMTARTWTPRALTQQGLFAFCHQVRGLVAAVDGTVERAMRRDEHWEYIQLGRHVERATQVGRLLWVHHNLAASSVVSAGVGDWRTLLRLAWAYEAYLRVQLPGPAQVTPTAFLLLDPKLPTSVAACLRVISVHIDGLGVVSLSDEGVGPKAAVASATRAAAAAAHAPESGLERLQQRLVKLDEAIASVFEPTMEIAGDVVYAQAARQAQN